MVADGAENRFETPGSVVRPAEVTEQRLTLHGERVEVSRRRVDTSLVRATRTTRTREQLVEADLSHERVEVERVPIGRTVDSVPPVRQEGDTTILSVVEEVVVERRLVLKEEVHVRRVKTTEHHRETVSLREQEATVTRTALAAGPLAAAANPTDVPSVNVPSINVPSVNVSSN